jgi:hypothetical protein
MNDILTYISQLTGLQPATLVLLGGVIITVSNAVSRVIPDDSTGLLGFIRIVTKVIGANVSSRITGSTTINDVAKSLLKTDDSKPEVEAALKETGALPSPGIAGITRGPGGKFTKTQSPWFVTVAVFFLMAMAFGFLGGCADKNLINTICSRQISIAAAGNLALKEAYLIKDPVKQQLAIDAANATLDLIKGCPPVGTPAPVGGL